MFDSPLGQENNERPDPASDDLASHDLASDVHLKKAAAYLIDRSDRGHQTDLVRKGDKPAGVIEETCRALRDLGVHQGLSGPLRDALCGYVEGEGRKYLERKPAQLYVRILVGDQPPGDLPELRDYHVVVINSRRKADIGATNINLRNTITGTSMNVTEEISAGMFTELQKEKYLIVIFGTLASDSKGVDASRSAADQTAPGVMNGIADLGAGGEGPASAEPGPEAEAESAAAEPGPEAETGPEGREQPGAEDDAPGMSGMSGDSPDSADMDAAANKNPDGGAIEAAAEGEGPAPAEPGREAEAETASAEPVQEAETGPEGREQPGAEDDAPGMSGMSGDSPDSADMAESSADAGAAVSNVPEGDSPQIEISQADAPGAEASQVEAPLAEAPQAESPQAGTPENTAPGGAPDVPSGADTKITVEPNYNARANGFDSLEIAAGLRRVAAAEVIATSAVSPAAASGAANAVRSQPQQISDTIRQAADTIERISPEKPVTVAEAQANRSSAGQTARILRETAGITSDAATSRTLNETADAIDRSLAGNRQDAAPANAAPANPVSPGNEPAPENGTEGPKDSREADKFSEAAPQRDDAGPGRGDNTEESDNEGKNTYTYDSEDTQNMNAQEAQNETSEAQEDKGDKCQNCKNKDCANCGGDFRKAANDVKDVMAEMMADENRDNGYSQTQTARQRFNQPGLRP